MQLQKALSLINRLLFAVAFVLLGTAVLEKLVNLNGYTILGAHYTPGRMLEFSGIILLFVVSLLLRSIREELRNA